MTGLWWPLTVVACVLFCCGAYAASCSGRRRSAGAPLAWLFVILAGGLLVRAVLAALTKGHPADIGTFGAWAGHAADGLTSFYAPGYFADYPPGYVYVLWIVGELRLLLGLDYDTPAFLLLLKMPAILADTAAVWVLYRLAAPVDVGGGRALYAFNPAVILDSAVWGQVDGVLTLFILLGVFFLEKSPAASAASFAAALLVKPQMLIFSPLLLLWFADRLMRQRDRRAIRDVLVFSGAGLAVFLLGVLPFAAREGAGWIFGKYADTLASYPYACLNAFNFFALAGGNGVSSDQTFLFMSYAAWGTVFIVLIVAFAALVAFRGADFSRFWYLAVFLCASVFVFSAKMHERYLFPALALSLGFFIVSQDRRALWLFAGFSVTQFINIADVLAWSHRDIYLVPRFSRVLLGVSAANVLLWLLLVGTGYLRYVARRPASRPLAITPGGRDPT